LKKERSRWITPPAPEKGYVNEEEKVYISPSQGKKKAETNLIRCWRKLGDLSCGGKRLRHIEKGKKKRGLIGSKVKKQAAVLFGQA